MTLQIRDQIDAYLHDQTLGRAMIKGEKSCQMILETITLLVIQLNNHGLINDQGGMVSRLSYFQASLY